MSEETNKSIVRRIWEGGEGVCNELPAGSMTSAKVRCIHLVNYVQVARVPHFFYDSVGKPFVRFDRHINFLFSSGGWQATSMIAKTYYCQ